MAAAFEAESGKRARSGFAAVAFRSSHHEILAEFLTCLIYIVQYDLETPVSYNEIIALRDHSAIFNSCTLCRRAAGVSPHRKHPRSPNSCPSCRWRPRPPPRTRGR